MQQLAPLWDLLILVESWLQINNVSPIIMQIKDTINI